MKRGREREKEREGETEGGRVPPRITEGTCKNDIPAQLCQGNLGVYE